MIVNGEKIRGTVYLDTSTKYYRGDKYIKHNCYRIDVTYNGRRYRDRFGSKEMAIEELRRLQRVYGQSNNTTLSNEE